MVDTPAHLRVFISSPGDVGDERRIAREVIDQLPHEPLLEGKVTIEAVAWDAPEAPAPLAASETPQESVNRYKGLAADADLTIVIVWRRIGTPFIGPQRKPDGTPYLSGTEFEYENAREAGREVWIYHRTEPFDPPDDDARQQRAALGEFLERVRGPKGTPARGGVNDYASAATFGPLFRKHLQAFVRRRLDAGESRARIGTLRAPYWLWDDVVTGGGGDGAATLEVAGPGGSVVVPRDIWPEFSDVEQSNRWFAGRSELFDALRAFIGRQPRGYFRIVGDAGLGKTALAVEIARRYRGPAYFVSATAGRTVPEQVLATLCAQAIVRYRLARVPLGSDAGRSSEVLLSLLNQAAASADSRPLVVTLDGLDEADATPSGHNWLHLPKTLPDG
ncbi:MAG TPA: AAA family ATPase, partial [Vicinamibacterales bacterium]|nr:AAA family ATPase [Vicinamibacterales bacterium]